MDHAGKAQNLFREGYNCAQAVAGAFSEELGMDPALAMRLVAGFGGGMGRLREVCGAVSGVVFVLSMKYGYSGPKDQQAKTELYRKVQAAGEAGAAENGSMICRELLQGQGGRGGDPSPRGESYYKKRPCVELVGCAAQIAERMLAAGPEQQNS